MHPRTWLSTVPLMLVVGAFPAARADAQVDDKRRSKALAREIAERDARAAEERPTATAWLAAGLSPGQDVIEAAGADKGKIASRVGLLEKAKPVPGPSPILTLAGLDHGAIEAFDRRVERANQRLAELQPRIAKAFAQHGQLTAELRHALFLASRESKDPPPPFAPLEGKQLERAETAEPLFRLLLSITEPASGDPR